MTTSALIWVTARDGSVHATRPPIMAAGQTMLCSRAYGRLDLRVRVQVGPGDGQNAGTCFVCCTAAGVATGTRTD